MAIVALEGQDLEEAEEVDMSFSHLICYKSPHTLICMLGIGGIKLSDNRRWFIGDPGSSRKRWCEWVL